MDTIYFIIPAGGVGRRMNALCPKQYLSLGGATVLEQTLALFLDQPLIAKGVVGIAPNDQYYPDLKLAHPDLMVCDAGESRAQTVLNCLRSLQQMLTADDWVIVHDAARPGLGVDELQFFIKDCCQQPDSVGAIMALPVSDTLKVGHEGQITQTLDRDHIYLAQTPQMFRFEKLLAAYEYCFARGITITDEASALEAMGYAPHIFAGYSHNFKITYPRDIAMMRYILSER